MDYVDNPNQHNDKSLKSQNAIISLHNDVNTSYEAYVQIYSRVHEAYEDFRNTMAQRDYQSDYEQLTIQQKNNILKVYPLKISEADPFVSNL